MFVSVLEKDTLKWLILDVLLTVNIPTSPIHKFAQCVSTSSKPVYMNKLRKKIRPKNVAFFFSDYKSELYNVKIVIINYFFSTKNTKYYLSIIFF